MNFRYVGRLTVTLLVFTLMSGCQSSKPVDRDAKPGSGSGASSAPGQKTSASIFQDEPLVNLKPLPVKKPASENAVIRAMPAPAESWIVSPADATLRHVLGKWAARAGWQLVWEASVDVPVTVSASFDGDFRSAVKRLFSSLSAAEVNLTGLMYSGNRVLRVTESGRRAQ
ncbi:toxin co-regulated pilus biosynthesis Q family protein [Pseudomonas sp. G(2018)]|uniref:toxin co-regulated pilus biosynthesis Q family protein n=1 Tax=Pseudomonas sp. G(2018) TaxID=2502242 RepID=UPI0010F8E034|nr:toxin co-regulated pilus biosynthesis Q family protein [Pseudomonas sp. G(2018)]